MSNPDDDVTSDPRPVEPDDIPPGHRASGAGDVEAVPHETDTQPAASTTEQLDELAEGDQGHTPGPDRDAERLGHAPDHGGRLG